MSNVFFASRSAVDAFTCARRWYKFREPTITKVDETIYSKTTRPPREVVDALHAYLSALEENGAITRGCPPNSIGFGPEGRPAGDAFCEESHRAYVHNLLLKNGSSVRVEFDVYERSADVIGQCKATGRVQAPASYDSQGLPVILVREPPRRRASRKGKATKGRRSR